MRPKRKLIEKTTEAINKASVDKLFCELLRALGLTEDEIEQAKHYDHDLYERYWYRKETNK